MNQKIVFISGFIGLLFGFLFAGTLGLDFFGDNDTNEPAALKKDEEAFRVAYNLDTSIYHPIYGADVQEKLDNDETFILYIGRDTCPYCQSFVPNLQAAAVNQNFAVIYHVDTIDPSNRMFVDDEDINTTPTTYLVKEGVIEEVVYGFKTTEAIEQLIVDTLGTNMVDDNNDDVEDDTTTLNQDIEDFKNDYNLTTSIYIPILADDIQEKLDNDETFILYIGRHTCPYCQAFVPNLQEAAQNQSISEIFHIDTTNTVNHDYLNSENISYTPTTYFVKDGVVVQVVVGFKTTAEIEQLLIDNLT